MQCHLPKITCEEKGRLLRRHAAAEPEYRRAIQVLGDAIGVLEEPDSDELDDFAASARRIGKGPGRVGAAH